jgi:fructosamine-3-kinase
LAIGENGRQLCLGEHTAISLINALIPGIVPKAVAWGKYTFTPPDTFFLIEEFHDLDMSLPSPKSLAHRAVQLHSQISPNGKFGFEVPTFDGIAPHPDGWETSWRVFFTRVLRKSVETDAAANGVWHELSRAAEHLLQNIVPQLLDPLQKGPDPIKPRLIHGDLWGGNIGKDQETGEIIFLDVGSFYGHNELDLGMWRRYGAQNLGQLYLDEYKCIFPPSEPQEGFDDRNRLYSMKFDLNASAGAPNEKARNT